ncbi:polyprotein [Phytophthora megakarya]|uniref:Polyprotein n=1 Tax=Phytophthora megakarya TaxID=4795 RepID=A0A225WDS8_9STRA|nr:polyprotein [Phytophthora megakarya]
MIERGLSSSAAVACPPCDAAEITQLPDRPWKHLPSDLRKGDIEQVCMLVHEDTRSKTKPMTQRPTPGLCRKGPSRSAPVGALGCSIYIDIFPDKVPAVLPLIVGPSTRSISCPSRHQPGHVRESLSPHSSPTFEKATCGMRIVHAFNKVNDATIPAQMPIPRKDMVLDTMTAAPSTVP